MENLTNKTDFFNAIGNKDIHVFCDGNFESDIGAITRFKTRNGELFGFYKCKTSEYFLVN